MRVHLSIGNNHSFALQAALLIYAGNGKSYVTLHDISADQKGPPKLQPAQPLTREFVDELLRSLNGRAGLEVLSAEVLACGDRSIVWWTKAQRRTMFYQSADGKCASLNGRNFPQPPLVWKVTHGELWIRALHCNKRPEAKTRLAFAPFWNLSSDGRVCIGTMRHPDAASVRSIEGWEKGFYESAFTHSNVGRLTKHEGGYESLWRSLADKKKNFPVATLIDLPQTLEQFVGGNEPVED